MKILFICLGNSERSIMAEALFNKLTKSGNAFSAGINVSNSPISDNVIKLMREDNIDISSKKKTQLTRDILNTVDKVFILCLKEECPIYLLKSDKITFWDVLNPWNKDYQFLINTKKLIEKYLNSII